MKKEILSLLFLAALFLGSLYNIRFLDSLTDELTSYIDSAEKFAADDDFENAVSEAEKALEKWAGMDFYTHIFISHDEIDETTDAFCEFLGDLYSGDSSSARGSALKIRAHLTSIASSEHLKLGSIL